MTGRMFEFVTEKPINLFGGKCPFKCCYCWARMLSNQYNMKKYQTEDYTLDERLWKRKDFKEGGFEFLCDMLDFSAAPREMISALLSWIKARPEAKFLLLTKNPRVYLEYWEELPENAVLGATIESDKDYPLLSKAPSQNERLYWMVHLAGAIREGKRKNQLFIAVEPILDFEEKSFELQLYWIKPWAVAVGFDNYSNNLPEPVLSKTMRLIENLEKFTKVYRKTLREKVEVTDVNDQLRNSSEPHNFLKSWLEA